MKLSQHRLLLCGILSPVLALILYVLVYGTLTRYSADVERDWLFLSIGNRDDHSIFCNHCLCDEGPTYGCVFLVCKDRPPACGLSRLDLPHRRSGTDFSAPSRREIWHCTMWPHLSSTPWTSTEVRSALVIRLVRWYLLTSGRPGVGLAEAKCRGWTTSIGSKRTRA